MYQLAIDILKKERIKITSQRISILTVLLKNESKAYSCSDLLNSLEQKINKTTIYRSMETLLKNNIILKLTDDKGEFFYTISRGDSCKKNMHPHLKCNKCGHLKCLPSLPKDYINKLHYLGVSKVNMILEGVCHNCKPH